MMAGKYGRYIMLSNERKKFKIGVAKRAELRSGLSNVVVVYGDGAPKYCYLQFSDALITAVGSALPRGVSNIDLAFIEVMFDQARAEWVVSTRYVSSTERCVLWKSGTRPTWLNELKSIGINYGNPTQDAASAFNPEYHRTRDLITA